MFRLTTLDRMRAFIGEVLESMTSQASRRLSINGGTSPVDYRSFLCPFSRNFDRGLLCINGRDLPTERRGLRFSFFFAVEANTSTAFATAFCRDFKVLQRSCLDSFQGPPLTCSSPSAVVADFNHGPQNAIHSRLNLTDSRRAAVGVKIGTFSLRPVLLFFLSNRSWIRSFT